MTPEDGAEDSLEESEYRRQVALVMTPGMVVLGLLMLVGFFGNVLVLYVYTMKLRRSPTNLFITALAACDVVVCCLCIPIEIVVMRYLYSFDRPWLCRVMRTVVIFCVVCSVSVLITIAVDRYKRICTPFAEQITIKTAKLAIGVGCLLSAVVSAPSMAVLGSKTVNKTTFIGHACATDDSMINTPYPGIYNGLQLLIAVGGIGTFTVLYTLMLKKVRSLDRVKTQINSKENRCEADDVSGVTNFETDVTKIDSNHGDTVRDDQGTSYNSLSEDEACTNQNEINMSPQQENNMKVVTSKKLWRGTYKTTFMMFLITAVFTIGFIPHLALMATRAAQKHTFEYLEGAPLGLYNLFLRIYFINSASNPIIYSFLSDNFRKEVKLLFKKFSRK